MGQWLATVRFPDDTLGFFTAVSASGGGVGILLGRVLTEYLSWRAIFLVNVPIGVAALLAAIRYIQNSRFSSGGFRTMDLPGAVSITASLTLLVYTLVNAQAWGWASGRVIGLFCAAAALLVAFLVIESRSRKPLVRLGIFASRSLSVGNVAMFLLMAAAAVVVGGGTRAGGAMMPVRADAGWCHCRGMPASARSPMRRLFSTTPRRWLIRTCTAC